MQIQNMDSIRNAQLKKERKIQVNNNGISAIFHLGDRQHFHSSCLQIQNPGDQLTLKFWLDDRFSINIYTANGWNQIATIDKNQVYLLQNWLYFKDRKTEKILTNGVSYLLARNNATIQLLSNALSGSEKIDPQIYEFINNPQFNQLNGNKIFDLEPWAYHNLNDSQKSAVQLVTNQKIAFIKGPPGCGKTRLIARLTTIFSFNGVPILVGAVSNTANMTILSAILKQCQEMSFSPNVVLFISKQLSSENLKHPPLIRSCTFRYKLLLKLMEVAGYQNTLQNWNYLQWMLDSFWKGENTYKTFISIYYQATALVFYEANVVIVTTTSAIKLDFKLDQSQKFKPFIAVLDQASQATWADAYCFLNKNVQKMVFIGDDRQLSPTVISQNQTLKETIFSKLNKKNPKYYVLLNEQYRMHPAISQFPNSYFYQGQLKNGVEAADRSTQIEFFSKYPLSFVNCEWLEQEHVIEKSGKRNYFNIGEIYIIQKILSMFPKQEFVNIGIISPYDMQIRYIKHIFGQEPFNYGLTARTCDGYQGSQKDFIIVSCVRSNKEGKIGFCNQQNRLNVTITRAKRGLVLIGNKGTFLSENQQPNVWHKYLEYLQAKNLIIEEKQLQSYKKYSNLQNKLNVNLEETNQKINAEQGQGQVDSQIPLVPQ